MSPLHRHTSYVTIGYLVLIVYNISRMERGINICRIVPYINILIKGAVSNKVAGVSRFHRKISNTKTQQGTETI